MDQLKKNPDHFIHYMDQLKSPTTFNYDINILAMHRLCLFAITCHAHLKKRLHHYEIHHNHIFSQENKGYSNGWLTLTCSVGSSAFN